MFYHEWKSLAKHKCAEVSILWVIEAQAGADSCNEDADHKKPQVLAECNSVIPTSGCDDVARFGGSALEAAKKFLKGNKVVDQFVENTVYCCSTNTPKFQMGVLGYQLYVNSNEGRESIARQHQSIELWY